MSEIPDNESFVDAQNGKNSIPSQPAFVPSQLGNRWVSIAALIEKVESAFIDEHGDGSTEIADADTPSKRLKLVLQTANYVFSVESVQLTAEEKAEIIKHTYSGLFGYGPLDELFSDERITTISLENAERASVRYGHGELVSLGSIFGDSESYQRIINRLVTDAAAEIRPDHPYMELGLKIGLRPICVNLVTPPVTIQPTVDIRLHPSVLPTWPSLIDSGFVTEAGIEILKALIASPYGLLIIGEPESGKTTLLNCLMNEISHPESTIVVERAGETRLPTGMEQLAVIWPHNDVVGVTFGQQILNAIEKSPVCLVLDEVRADEPQSIAPLLHMENVPRLIWSFRGTTFAKRLQSSLSMLARRTDVGGGDSLIRSLYERLPFVIAVNRVGGQLRLWGIGEWQFKHSLDYPTYVSLMQVDAGRLRLTGEEPLRELSLPAAFWNAG